MKLKEKNEFQYAFSNRKIWIAVILGLSIASFMIYRSISQQNFIEVSKGQGNYIWIDGNHNHIIDTSIPQDFKKRSKGNYKIETIGDTLQLINWSYLSFFWLLLALIFMVGRDFFYMWRIKILTKNELKWRQCFDIIMLWEFASALSPGVVGGTTVAMFILKKEKINLGRSTAIVMITALMDNLFFLFLIPFVFLFIDKTTLFPAHFSIGKSVEYIFWTGFCIKLILCLFLFFSIFLQPKLAAKFLKSIFSIPFLKKWQHIGIQTGNELQLASKELKTEKLKFWITSMLATFFSWTSRYLVINCILNAFVKMDFITNILLLGKQLILWLLMMISPTPGGSGIAEYAFGELLSSFSSSLILIAALALIWRLISYFPYLIIGLFVLPKWMNKK